MKKILWVKVACLFLFYTNLIYSEIEEIKEFETIKTAEEDTLLRSTFEHLPAFDHYKSCLPVSECLSESQLEQKYAKILSTHTPGTNSYRAALLDLSKNYSHRLECSMSLFLNEDLPELCPTPSDVHASRIDRIRNRFSSPTASGPSFSIDEEAMLPNVTRSYRKMKIPTRQELHGSNVDRIKNQFSKDVALSNPSFSFDKNVMNPSPQELDSFPLIPPTSYPLPIYLAEIQRKSMEPNYRPPYKIDPICFHAGSLRGVQAIDKRYECFHYNQASPSRKNDNKGPCAEGNPTCWLNPTSGPCLSQTYAEKLSNTFDRVAECVGLNREDKNSLFAILNHESAFMPNARSHSDTRCMGQLAKRTIWELTSLAAAGVAGESNPMGFEEVLEKCPELNDYTIPADIKNNLLPYALEQTGGSIEDKAEKEVSFDEQFGFGEKSLAPREHQKTHYSMTCKTVSNPVTCLLYATLNYRFHKNNFDNILPQDSPLISNTDRQKFKDLVLKLVYNFGRTLVETHLKNFLKEVDCAEKSCSTPVFKEKLDQKEQINAQELSKEFIRYVFMKKDTWLPSGSKIRCEEVKGYVLGTFDDLNFFQNRNIIEGYWNNQVNKSPAAFNSFFNEVQNKCSPILQETLMSQEDLKNIFEQTTLCNFNSPT